MAMQNEPQAPEFPERSGIHAIKQVVSYHHACTEAHDHGQRQAH